MSYRLVTYLWAVGPAMEARGTVFSLFANGCGKINISHLKIINIK